MDDVTVTDPVASETPVAETCGSSCEVAPEVECQTAAVEEHLPAEPVAEVSPAEAELAGAT
jgi:hypothetical protein